MEEIKKKSTFNIMYGTSLFIVLGFALSAIGVYAWNFEIGIPIFSEKVSDWAAFATYLSGMVSPFIALLVLFYVVRSYGLQKVEFLKASTTMQSQLEIDCLLRRQDSIIKESNRLIELVLAKFVSTAYISDEKYIDWYNSLMNFKSTTTQPKPVKYYFENFVKFKVRGDYPNGRPDFPGDFNYLITLIRNIDALCSEIVRIDQQLEEVSSVFSTHVSEAFVISASGQIGDLIVNFRKLGVFNTTNRDYLNNF
tara:strand:- start:2593 stop:3348 length:756 start_codon:yes stop_codon:yes gene_type:complete